MDRELTVMPDSELKVPYVVRTMSQLLRICFAFLKRPEPWWI